MKADNGPGKRETALAGGSQDNGEITSSPLVTGDPPLTEITANAPDLGPAVRDLLIVLQEAHDSLDRVKHELTALVVRVHQPVKRKRSKLSAAALDFYAPFGRSVQS